MQEKPTAALEQELSACADLRTYLKTNTDALCAPGLPALLQQLMQSKGLSRAELLRRSELNAVYGYQILAGKRRPGRDSLLCLCFGLGLTPSRRRSSSCTPAAPSSTSKSRARASSSTP